MGVPTVGGEIVFNDIYAQNPFVNVFCLGIAKKDKIFLGKAAGVGNPVIYFGSKTGRDGIHGATMASDSFDEQSDAEAADGAGRGSVHRESCCLKPVWN